MIAPTSHRRQGLGRAAILTFLRYFEHQRSAILNEFATKEGMNRCGLSRLKVKIGSKNEKSIKLFESIGFVKIKDEPNYFGELELVLEKSSLSEKIEGMLEKWSIEGYREFWYHEGKDG